MAASFEKGAAYEEIRSEYQQSQFLGVFFFFFYLILDFKFLYFVHYIQYFDSRIGC